MEPYILLLRPEADDRDIDDVDVMSIKIKPDVKIQDDKIVWSTDRGTQKTLHHRVIQCDIPLNEKEKKEARRQFEHKHKSIVYWRKIKYVPEGDFVEYIKNIGQNPTGFECHIMKQQAFFTTVINPQFDAKIIIPNDKLYSIIENG